MPHTRIAPHVHLEIGCHCPTMTVPTEAERLQVEIAMHERQYAALHEHYLAMIAAKLDLERKLAAMEDVRAAARLAVGGSMGGFVALRTALARYDQYIGTA